ncbi:MAG: isoprenylcysteine carboxylmethyltransferase family protein [Alphaproteobacteria bacterium]|nr:isoprenylcysteine carboxylmethyltransferase family protein [Alphaproteobacteria bacterium]
MLKTVGFLYGVVSYALFFGVFLYSIGFVGNYLVPRSIDSGGLYAPEMTALIINVALLGLFAVQHSVMARPAFKAWWTKIIPEPLERSTYVLLSSLVLALLFCQWRPMIGIVWYVHDSTAALALEILFFAGWGVVLLSTFMINHFDLFGLRQVWFLWRGEEETKIGFKTPLLYQLVRHPIMLGFVIAFWATPIMTQGHLLFAVATTGYILIALKFEEHDLVTLFGDKYREYQKQVPMLFPWKK